MFISLKKYRLIAVSLIFIALISLLIFPNTARADAFFLIDNQDIEIQYWCDGFPKDAFCYFFTIPQAGMHLVAYLFYLFTKILILIGAFLLQLMFAMGVSIFEWPIISEGAKFSFVFINSLFVLSLILIAFMTILRVSKYAPKTLLRNLIIAALLVNFSFLIAGVILDITNVFANRFIQDTKPDAIGKAINPQVTSYLFGARKGNEGGPGDSGRGGTEYDVKAGIDKSGFSQWLGILLGLSYGAILNLLFAIAILSVALTTLVRNIWIIFLLILMPIIWALWILPGFGEYWKKWWDAFLRYAIYLPTAMFFVALATKTTTNLFSDFDTLDSLKRLPPAITQVLDQINLGGEVLGINIPALIAISFNALLIFGLFMAAVVAAKKSGIVGAALGLAAGGFIAKAVMGVPRVGLKLAGKGTSEAGKYVGTRPTKAASRGLSSLIGGTPLKFIPGAKGLSNKLAGLGKRDKEVEAFRKEKLSGLTDDQLISRSSAPGVGPVAKSAMFKELLERKKIGDLEKNNPEIIPEYIKSLKATNPGTDVSKLKEVKELLSVNPLFAKYTKKENETEESAIKKASSEITASKAENISAEALKDERVIMGLNKNVARAIEVSGSAEQSSQLRKTLEKMAAGTPSKVGSELLDVSRELSSIAKQLKEIEKKAGGPNSEQAHNLALRQQELTNKQAQLRDQQKNEPVPDTASKAKILLDHINQSIGNPDK